MQALQAADQLGSAAAEMGTAMPEMADLFGASAIFVYVRFNAWNTVSKMQPAGEKTMAMQAAWSYARALGLSGTGDRVGAKQEQDRFEQMRKNLPANAPWGYNSAEDIFRLASEILHARLSPNTADPCDHWRSAVDVQDHLMYNEPPDWYYPVRESLGACLLHSGKNAEAAQVFREGVRRSPRNGRMLFGLWESLKAQGKTQEAEYVKREFDAAWAGSDVQLRIEDL